MFQGWRPPGASTAIRPLRVVGWLAPIATLVNLLKNHPRLPSSKGDSCASFEYWILRMGFLWRFPKGKIVVEVVACLAGIPEPGTGQSA